MERLAAQLLMLLATLAGAQEPKAPGAPSARALIERAAYVEEHERDFTQAAALFTQAENAARTAGDESTAREAAAGRQRAEARRDGAPARADPTQDAAIDNRVGDLLGKLAEYSPLIVSSDAGWATFRALQDDLVVYGAAAAPRLESLLEPRMVDIGDHRVSMDTRMAARLLALLEVDAAAEALGRGLQSKDPLIRRAIAGVLSQTRHRALLEQAAKDPVSQVRSVAINRLLLLEDPALQPLAEAEARNGDLQACRWLARRDPQRLLELMGEEGSDASRHGFEALNSHRLSLPVTRENAERLLRLAGEGSDETQRSAALDTLSALFRSYWAQAPLDLRLHVQERVLADPTRYPENSAEYLLSRIGDIRAFEHLSRRWAVEPAGSEESKSLAIRCADLAKSLGAQDFAALARLYREIPESSASWSQQGPWHAYVLDRLSELVNQVSMGSLLAGLDGLEGEKRTRYLSVVRYWLESQPGMQANGLTGSIDKACIPVMREMLDSKDSTLVSAALRGLARAGDVECLPRILTFSSRDENVRSRVQSSIHGLVQQDVEGAARVIMASIERGEIPLASIRYFESARAMQLFRECWSRQQDERSREQLLEILIGDIEGSEADGAILEHWQEIAQASSRADALKRFGENLYEPAMPILGLALEDPDAYVRQVAREAFRAFKEQREALEEFAAWTLGDREARAQVQDLIGLLASPERGVVLGAVKALGAVRGRAALPALVRLLERDDPVLEQAILAAIEAIGQ